MTGPLRCEGVSLLRGERAVLSVTDDGPGIPDEIRDSLFRPGVSGRSGGSGLGLAMVHRIATDHKGALKWDRTEAGTRFDLVLADPPYASGEAQRALEALVEAKVLAAGAVVVLEK